MNRKQFCFVLLALAIVGGAGFVLLKRNRQSWTTHETRSGDKVLPAFPYNSVASIHVKGAASEFHVARQDGIWRIPERDGYSANYPVIKDLLLRIRDLKVVQSDTLGASQLPRVELAAPTEKIGAGTLIEFADSTQKPIASLVVGKRHLRPQSQSDPYRLKGLFDGCYIRLLSDPENVMLVSDDLPAVTAEPPAWLDKSFIKIEKLKSLSLLSTNGTTVWTLTRPAESQPWLLADADPAAGEVLDSTAASQTVEVLPFLSFVDVLPRDKANPLTQSKPSMLFAETFDHFFYSINFIAAPNQQSILFTIKTKAELSGDGGDMADQKARLAREQSLASWTYVADAAAIQPILRERAQLLQKKLAAAN
jgi:hypothetical protein